jgi:hypothetical protein
MIVHHSNGRSIAQLNRPMRLLERNEELAVIQTAIVVLRHLTLFTPLL